MYLIIDYNVPLNLFKNFPTKKYYILLLTILLQSTHYSDKGPTFILKTT